MDRRSFLDRILHNDKLMMIISLVLAFLIWVAVEAGAGNHMEHEITGVPISITLNEFVSQSTNLRIVEGAEATATVKVKGPRSIVGALTPQDLSEGLYCGGLIPATGMPVK